MDRRPLGAILREKGVVEQAQLEEALQERKTNGKFLGEILVERGVVSRETIFEALTDQKKADFIRLREYEAICPEVIRLIPEEIAYTSSLLPVTRENDLLVLAMSDPVDIVAIDVVRRLTGLRIKVYKANKSEVYDAIARFYRKRVVPETRGLARKDLGQILLEKKLIDLDQLKHALTKQEREDKLLGEILVEKGYVSKSAVLEALTGQEKAEFVRLHQYRGLREKVVRLIPESLARKFVLVAVAKKQDVLTLAIKDALDIVAVDAVQRMTGFRVKLCRADEKEILETIDRFYH